MRVCQESSCKDGYEDMGLTCTRCQKVKRGNGFGESCDTYNKLTYQPKKTPIKNPCLDGNYLNDGKCFEDCQQFGLENCENKNECASSTSSCGSGINFLSPSYLTHVIKTLNSVA